MELILVRHGQPAWSVDGLGRNDPDLTELGRAQVAAVADRLADTAAAPATGAVDRLFVSPATRAAQTAAPIATALGLPAERRDWMIELHNPPAWEGAPIERIEQAFAEYNTRTREEWWDGMPGGESFRDFHRRITGGIESLLAELAITPTGEHGLWSVPADAPGRVVLVAHGGTNSMTVAHLLGAPPEPWEWVRFMMGHASVAVLATIPVAGAHVWSLQALGDANHLPLEHRTV